MTIQARRSRTPRTRSALALAVVVLVALIAAACSSGGGSATSNTSTTARTTSAQHSGPVDVLYAGSLVGVMEQGIGPAFDAVTGYTFNGFSGGSDALATEIKGGTQQGDVFVSASPKVNTELMGSANGDWVSWYANFATSPLVIGYNKNSKFAADLQSKPWYQVVTEPGFILGRTDPATDPKGKLALQALQQAATSDNLPALNAIGDSTTNVYPEQGLVGLLQAGQLDAGFFYASEAAQAGIPTVSIAPIHLEAQYTVTVLNRAPHAAGGEAFVKFLLSPIGKSILAHDGLTLVTPPSVTGSDQVPESLKATLHVG
jgi:molybdate/tungstate transport system substrate-binding protein